MCNLKCTNGRIWKNFSKESQKFSVSECRTLLLFKIWASHFFFFTALNEIFQAVITRKYYTYRNNFKIRMLILIMLIFAQCGEQIINFTLSLTWSMTAYISGLQGNIKIFLQTTLLSIHFWRCIHERIIHRVTRVINFTRKLLSSKLVT